jgi:periplasmic divalent cation tolerance protein
LIAISSFQTAVERKMSRYIQVVTTVDSKEDATRIAQHLVENQAAACVQVVGPMESTYRWEGALETNEEWRCLIKTEKRHFNAVRRLISAMHPYEVPEIISLPILQGSREYLGWISEQVKGQEKRGQSPNNSPMVP